MKQKTLPGYGSSIQAWLSSVRGSMFGAEEVVDVGPPQAVSTKGNKTITTKSAYSTLRLRKLVMGRLQNLMREQNENLS